jgi:hypothetical protein
MLAFEVAAPWTIGTHFKDHRVAPRPEARPLHFEVAGSVLGEGGCASSRVLPITSWTKRPFPEKSLVMEMEVGSPEDVRTAGLLRAISILCARPVTRYSLSTSMSQNFELLFGRCRAWERISSSAVRRHRLLSNSCCCTPSTAARAQEFAAQHEGAQRLHRLWTDVARGKPM